MSIPDEVFKAANDAYIETLTDLRLREGGGFKVGSQNRRALLAALTAAAPLLKAEAWEEGSRAGWSDRTRSFMEARTSEEEVAKATPNPYRRASI